MSRTLTSITITADSFHHQPSDPSPQNRPSARPHPKAPRHRQQDRCLLEPHRSSVRVDDPAVPVRIRRSTGGLGLKKQQALRTFSQKLKSKQPTSFSVSITVSAPQSSKLKLQPKHTACLVTKPRTGQDLKKKVSWRMRHLGSRTTRSRRHDKTNHDLEACHRHRQPSHSSVRSQHTIFSDSSEVFFSIALFARTSFEPASVVCM